MMLTLHNKIHHNLVDFIFQEEKKVKESEVAPQ